MTEECEKSPLDQSLLGSIHVSTSNLMSYSLVTMATMLAFYFTFQGGLLAGYAFLYGGVTKAEYNGLAVGKILSIALLTVIVVFNIWSYKIVRVFIDYFFSFIESGASLEETAGISEKSGLYRAMLLTYNRPGGHGHLFVLTRVFFVCNSLFWMMMGVWPWLT